MESVGQPIKTIRVPGRPLKKKASPKLPWPRLSDDAKVPLGIDVVAMMQDIKRIVHKFFRVDGYPMEELMQEVYVAIIHQNYTRSAHNPSKSSFGHYVYMVANNVCVNLVHKKRRYDRERDLSSGSDDDRAVLDTVEDTSAVVEDSAFLDRMDQIEAACRMGGRWDHARYIRAVRSGASADVVRDALSFGSRKVSAKDVRAWRNDLHTAVVIEGVFLHP